MRPLLLPLLLAGGMAHAQNAPKFKIDLEASLKISYELNVIEDYTQTLRIIPAGREAGIPWRAFNRGSLVEFTAAYGVGHYLEYRLIDSLRGRTLRYCVWAIRLVDRFLNVERSRRMGFGGMPLIWVQLRF
jgi:hypothetical protein